jgi:hypothetical protein
MPINGEGDRFDCAERREDRRSVLNPYEHTCVDRPHLPCNACDWVDHNPELAEACLKALQRSESVLRLRYFWRFFFA